MRTPNKTISWPDEELWTAVSKAASAENMSRSAWLRKAAEERLARGAALDADASSLLEAMADITQGVNDTAQAVNRALEAIRGHG